MTAPKPAPKLCDACASRGKRTPATMSKPHSAIPSLTRFYCDDCKPAGASASTLKSAWKAYAS